MMKETEETPNQSSESQVKKEIDDEDEHVAMYSPFGTIDESSVSELEAEPPRKRHKHEAERRQPQTVTVSGAKQKPKCSICGHIYSCTSSLATHMKIHLEEKSHICETCGKVFRRRHHLASHELSVHQGIKALKQFICDVCGKEYTEKRNLKNHMAVHNGVKDFKCDICGKMLWHKTGLKGHILRVHESATTGRSTKKYITRRSDPCEVCGKTFVDTLSLTRHMYIHTGEKEASCSICKMDFARKSSLNKHMKRRHNPFRVKKKRGGKKKLNSVSDSDKSVKTIATSSKQLIDNTTVPEKRIEKSGSEKEFFELYSIMKAGTVYSDSELIHSQSFDTDMDMELRDDLNKSDQVQKSFISSFRIKKEPADPQTCNTSHEVAVDKVQNSSELTVVIKKESDSLNIEAGTVTRESAVDIKHAYAEFKVSVTVGPDLLPSVQIVDEFTAAEEVDDDQLEPMQSL